VNSICCGAGTRGRSPAARRDAAYLSGAVPLSNIVRGQLRRKNWQQVVLAALHRAGLPSHPADISLRRRTPVLPRLHWMMAR